MGIIHGPWWVRRLFVEGLDALDQHAQAFIGNLLQHEDDCRVRVALLRKADPDTHFVQISEIPLNAREHESVRIRAFECILRMTQIDFRYFAIFNIAEVGVSASHREIAKEILKAYNNVILGVQFSAGRSLALSCYQNSHREAKWRRTVNRYQQNKSREQYFKK